MNIMSTPLIQVLPNSSAVSAPGWAYVPDTGYDPSKAPIQPTARKRNARITGGGASGGQTALSRQNNVVLRRLADLDKDNFKDVQIPIPTRGDKEGSGGGGRNKGKTAATRKILTTGKTFANYVADEEALAAIEQQQQQQHPHHHAANRPRAGSLLRRESTLQQAKDNNEMDIDSQQQQQPSLDNSSSTPSQADTSNAPAASPLPLAILPPEDLRLLSTSVPAAPSAALLEALVSAPPLSFNAARAPPPPPSGKPARLFCELCGYWGRIRCVSCGARVCGLECKRAHDSERCQKYSG